MNGNNYMIFLLEIQLFYGQDTGFSLCGAEKLEKIDDLLEGST